MIRAHAQSLSLAVLLTAASLGTSAPLAAQTTGIVQGRITSAGSDDGLPGASISFSDTSAGAITRADGAYRVTLRPGTCELRVLGCGSKRDTVVFTVGGTVTRNPELAKSATQLDQVAVTGSRAGARTVVSSPVQVDVLNAAELTQTGRVETSQMIQAVAPEMTSMAALTTGTARQVPDQNKDLGDVATGYGGHGTFGVFRFSGLSPFGFNGRYM